MPHDSAHGIGSHKAIESSLQDGGYSAFSNPAYQHDLEEGLPHADTKPDDVVVTAEVAFNDGMSSVHVDNFSTCSFTMNKPHTPDKATAILEAVPSDRQLTVKFHAVCAWAPHLFAQPKSQIPSLRNGGGADVKSSMRQILHSIYGVCRPGEVLALMGPSGSGKTSLLSILGGRPPRMVMVEGEVLFNGDKPNKQVKRKIGFVMQDDLLFAALTVFETLYYAAMLRLPKDMSRAKKLERVESVISALGLSKCRDTPIGGFMMRGVSGGERKRVSVGHELLIDPAVLMLDEPTSGLDSTTAMNLVSTLRDLAAGGRSVITTIHQPSSQMYQQLDSLLLLADGRPMYFGRAALAHEWFSHLGYKLPYGMNVADYILDLASGAIDPPERVSSSMTEQPADNGLLPTVAYLTDVASAFIMAHNEGMRNSSDVDRVDIAWKANSGDMDARRRSFIRINAAANAADKLEGMEARGMAADARWGASYWQQFTVLLSRCLKVRRFDALAWQTIVQMLGVAVITGLFWWQKGHHLPLTVAQAKDVTGLLFFEMIFMSFSTFFSALFTFPAEFQLLLKERASGMYRLSAYYVARTMSDLPMTCLLPTAFVTIVYWMGWLRPVGWAFFCNLFSALLLVLTAQSYGLLIGAVCMNPKTGQAVATVIMLAFMLVGGFFVAGIPVWIRWIRYLSFVYWGYSLLTNIEFHNRKLVDCSAGLTVTGQCAEVTDISSALSLPRSVDDQPWLPVVVLIAMLVALRAAVYFALNARTKS